MHTDDSLYHAIIAAHHDRDPRAARHLAIRSPVQDLRHDSASGAASRARAEARLGILSPIALELGGLISRSFAALASVSAAVVRPLPFVRVRSTAPCCAVDCG